MLGCCLFSYLSYIIGELVFIYESENEPSQTILFDCLINNTEVHMSKIIVSNVQLKGQLAKNSILVLKYAVRKKLKNAELLVKEDLEEIRSVFDASEHCKLELIHYIYSEKTYELHHLSFAGFCYKLFGVSKSEAYKYVNRAKAEACIFRGIEFIGTINNNDFLDHCHLIRIAFGDESLKGIYRHYRENNSKNTVHLLLKLLGNEYPNVLKFLCSKSKKTGAYDKNLDLPSPKYDNAINSFAKKDKEVQKELSAIPPEKIPEKKDSGGKFETYDEDSFADAPTPAEVRKMIKPQHLWINTMFEQRLRNKTEADKVLFKLIQDYDFELLGDTLEFLDYVRTAISQKLSMNNVSVDK